MKLKSKNIIAIIIPSLLFMFSCGNDESNEDVKPKVDQDKTPYVITQPYGFPSFEIPEDNPMTVKGVELGRMLFYEKMLSGDNTMSCASCHKQENGFSDPNQFSKGIDGLFGDRQASTIINAAWSDPFFWDGRSATLELQAVEPIKNPIELHQKLDAAVDKLQLSENYPEKFQLAFGTYEITAELIAKAIAQFERIIISSDSKYDKWANQVTDYTFTELEVAGSMVFFTEKGDCFHCHSGSLFTDNEFRNNGLNSSFVDLGLGGITKNPLDNGKFKTPTLRNIEFSAPYMHDGRFETLEDVVNFYSEGLQPSSTIDPLMKKVNKGGLQLTDYEKKALIAYLKCLSDNTYTTNSDFSNPF